jgi:hypothetical protein
MGSVSIFSLEFSGTVFACSRDFTGGYRLQVGDYVVMMMPGEAATLARGGAHIRIRAQIASRFDREMKAGATYRRDVLAVDGRAARLEIGVSDGGDVVFGSGGSRMTLTDTQAQLLLAVLDTLAADVSTIYRATAPAHDDMRWGIAAGLRGPDPDLALPHWADDEKWK